MWYVLQTISGKEEELVDLIHILLDQELYKECFIIQSEWMKRLGGKWIIQVRPLFPGYVFIETAEPEGLFIQLKMVPRFSRLLGNGNDEFISVTGEERRYLETISEITAPGAAKNRVCREERIVRLSEVKVNAHGPLDCTKGPLQNFQENIVQINLHKRLAVVERRMFREKQTLLFGIRLQKDGEERCTGNM